MLEIAFSRERPGSIFFHREFRSFFVQLFEDRAQLGWQFLPRARPIMSAQQFVQLFSGLSPVKRLGRCALHGNVLMRLHANHAPPIEFPAGGHYSIFSDRSNRSIASNCSAMSRHCLARSRYCRRIFPSTDNTAWRSQSAACCLQVSTREAIGEFLTTNMWSVPQTATGHAVA